MVVVLVDDEYMYVDLDLEYGFWNCTCISIAPFICTYLFGECWHEKNSQDWLLDWVLARTFTACFTVEVAIIFWTSS
jgi:hypothetical protein